jgi:hypothetical protein
MFENVSKEMAPKVEPFCVFGYGTALALGLCVVTKIAKKIPPWGILKTSALSQALFAI